MDDKAALKMLQYLLKEEPGALKIINHFHACSDDLVTDAMVASDPSRREACEAYAREHDHVPGMVGGYQSVGHYRLHDVKRLEEVPNKKGVYVAYADDELGTQCGGLPSALLARLTEHARS